MPNVSQATFVCKQRHLWKPNLYVFVAYLGVLTGFPTIFGVLTIVINYDDIKVLPSLSAPYAPGGVSIPGRVDWFGRAVLELSFTNSVSHLLWVRETPNSTGLPEYPAFVESSCQLTVPAWGGNSLWALWNDAFKNEPYYCRDLVKVRPPCFGIVLIIMPPIWKGLRVWVHV